MKPEGQSKRILGITRSKAKMYEYSVPEEYHIKITEDPAQLFTLTIGLLGDYAAKQNHENPNKEELKELKKNLLFAAHFFDSYLEAKFNMKINPYLLFIGSAAYYLCDLPGSSKVLAKRLGKNCPNLDALWLENLLLWLLQEDWGIYYVNTEGLYGKYIDNISRIVANYFSSGSSTELLLETITSLRKTAYDNGSPRQVLFSDIISAIVKKRIQNSTWHCLPKYTDISVEQWRYVLQNKTFIRELWPAQQLLGQHGVFRGKSAVVQMPTSAGKTKAIEIVLRSAFISNRASIAVIVAPFRALCHEIKNSLLEAFLGEDFIVDELSDVLQKDFLVEDFMSQMFSDIQTESSVAKKHILIVTPEKLLYMLRQAPDIANTIGLLIYDEGHQFDSGKRGITYELLLTSLRSMVSKEIQTILISAVIRNATDVGKWLKGDECEIISGINLIPTYRTIAFTSWIGQLGRIEFVNEDDPDINEYFVPRILEQHKLHLRPRERNERVFPEKNNGKTIALYLGLKLLNKGSVAVFCGTKQSASSLCEKIVDVYSRGFSVAKPVEFSNQNEIDRLIYLHQCNLGSDAIATQAARSGVFMHHGNTPQGIRMAVEHAIKEGLAKYVICTSTLAQGVNLPIRYLIVTSVYQGQDRIKVRDFHNLIGRAGRSGMYTEGSIIFADAEVYDKRNSWKENWKWKQVKEILDPSNSEPCVSTLLSIFEPLKSDDDKYFIKMDSLELARRYLQEESSIDELVAQTARKYSGEKFTREGLERQIEWKVNIISSIENYLLAHWDDSGVSLQENGVKQLAMDTLAYYLADEEKKNNILELFKLLADNIKENIPDASKRKAFGKTLYGVKDAVSIDNWVSENIENILSCVNNGELLATLWPIISQNITNKSFLKCDSADILLTIAKEWIVGMSFFELHRMMTKAGACIIAGEQRRHYKIEHVVDICENALSYDGTLVIGAVTENIRLIQSEDAERIVNHLEVLQKQLKYGLYDSKAIILYEMGISDRVIATELGLILDENLKPYRKGIISDLKKKENLVRNILSKYPIYFSQRFDALL